MAYAHNGDCKIFYETFGDPANPALILVNGQREWGTPEFADEWRWRRDAERAFDRCFHPSGAGRQLLAAMASEPRAKKLPSIKVPALVIHGDGITRVSGSDNSVTPFGYSRTYVPFRSR